MCTYCLSDKAMSQKQHERLDTLLHSQYNYLSRLEASSKVVFPTVQFVI